MNIFKIIKEDDTGQGYPCFEINAECEQHAMLEFAERFGFESVSFNTTSNEWFIGRDKVIVKKEEV